MPLRPLGVRARLTLWHAATLMVIICIFSAAIFAFVRGRLYHDLDQQLGREAASAERVYREDAGELRELESRFGVTLFAVLEGDRVIYRTDGWEHGGFRRLLEDGGGTPVRSWSAPDGRPYRVFTHLAPDHRIVVVRVETPVRSTLRTLAAILLMGIPCAAALATAGGYLLAARVLSPIGAMAAQARKITADSLGERLPVGNPYDEFGRLATVFNDTLTRLHAAFDQLRRFTADASHELRTPLTVMRSVGEVALHESRDPAAYRDVIGSLLEEVDRLTRLVENLLTLTRADSGRAALAREAVDLGRLATTVAEQLRVLAEEKDQSLSVHATTRVVADCDPTVLKQGLINLLDNAIKYTPSQGAIDVRVRQTSSGEAAVEVQDTGPGIRVADRDRIFERFYRVQKDRSTAAGGLGLGLAIARWAVEANGGRIELSSDEGHGSLFRIVLPTGR